MPKLIAKHERQREFIMGESSSSRMAVALVSDSNYLSRCATALESGNFSKFAHLLAVDEGCAQLSEYFPDLSIHAMEVFLRSKPKAKRQLEMRNRAEQIFSIGPAFLLEKSDLVEEGGWLVYADSDLFFIESLQTYLDSLPPCNVVIAPHRHYLWNESRLAKYGEYNVGLVAFRKNLQGLRALEFWAESCLDWCYDKAEDGKYADQKYLELFASVAPNVYVDNSLGANLAPWNSFLKKISLTKSGEILVGSDKLIYFHAQGLKQKNGRWILGHLNYLSFAGPRLKKLVYRPYLEKLEEWAQKPGFESFGTSRAPTKLLGRFAASITYGLSLLTGQTIKILDRRSGAQ